MTKAAARKENFIIKYLKETRAELKKVSWPTWREAFNLTGIVIAVTVFMSALLGVIDFIFAKLFSLIIH